MIRSFAVAALTALLFFGTIRPAAAQWVSANGFTPDVFALAAHGDTLYGGARSGIVRSTNGGADWTVTGAELSAWRVTSMVCPGLITLAGTAGGGMFRTTDAGATWIHSGTGLTDTTVTTMSMYGTSVLAALGAGGMFVSTDKGVRWSAAGLARVRLTAIGVANSGVILAGSATAVYRSTDGGTTWSSADTSVPDARTFYANGDTVWAGTWGTGVYRSLNNGITWSNLTKTLPLIAALTAYNGTLWAASSDGAATSVDGGSTWVFKSGLGGQFLWSALIHNGALIVGARFGVYRLPLAPPGKWESLIASPAQSTEAQIVTEPGYLYAVGYNVPELFRSTNNGATWKALLHDVNASYMTICGNALFLGTDKGILRSTNHGDSWDTTTSGSSAMGIYSITSDGQTVYACGNGALWHSSDLGATWIYFAPPSDSLGPLIPSQIVVHHGMVYLDAQTDWANPSSTVPYRTSNFGVDWERMTIDSMAETVGPHVFCVQGDTVYLGSPVGLYRSIDSGSTWGFAGLANQFGVTAMVPVDGAIIAATGLDGSFRSPTSGDAWTRYNTGLEGVLVASLATTGQQIVAATASRVSDTYTVQRSGVWQRPLAEAPRHRGSTDTLVPVLHTGLQCGARTDTVRDLPVSPAPSGIAQVRWRSIAERDTTWNFSDSVLLDPAGFHAGDASARIRVHVADPRAAAHGALYVADIAGNDTVYEFAYRPDSLHASSSVVIFDSVSGGTHRDRFFDLRNPLSQPVRVIAIRMRRGGSFGVMDSVPLPRTLPGGGRLTIAVRYSPTAKREEIDTVDAVTECAGVLMLAEVRSRWRPCIAGVRGDTVRGSVGKTVIGSLWITNGGTDTLIISGATAQPDQSHCSEINQVTVAPGQLPLWIAPGQESALRLQVRISALLQCPVNMDIGSNSACGSAAGTIRIMGSTAVDDAMPVQSGLAALTVFPNPLTDEARVLVGDGLARGQDATLRIYDVLGRVVFDLSAIAHSTSGPVLIHASDLGAAGASGIYRCVLESRGVRSEAMIVVLR